MTTPTTTLTCQRSSYQILKASGKDIRTYLQSQITQDVGLLTPKHPIYTAILSPQGKIIADMHIIDIGDELVLIASHDYAEALVERLRRFSMGHDIRLGMVDALSLLSIQGEHALEVAESIQQNIQASMPMSEAASQGLWLVLEKKSMPQALVDMAHLDAVQVCSDDTMEQASIAHGFPRFGRDWDASVHPMNANLVEMNGVSFDKGCYVGQEVTSRMHWRGGIKKKLYHVRIDGGLPQTPCAIQTSVKIGILSSAALDADGQVWGIAHLPIETVTGNAPLSLENSTQVHVIKACHA